MIISAVITFSYYISICRNKSKEKKPKPIKNVKSNLSKGINITVEKDVVRLSMRQLYKTCKSPTTGCVKALNNGHVSTPYSNL